MVQICFNTRNRWKWCIYDNYDMKHKEVTYINYTEFSSVVSFSFGLTGSHESKGWYDFFSSWPTFSTFAVQELFSVIA